MKKKLFLSLLLVVSLFTACSQNEPATPITAPENESTNEDAFEPYFLPLSEFVFEGEFDTLLYNPGKPYPRQVTPLYFELNNLGGTIPYMNASIFFEEVNLSDTISDLRIYAFECNMPLNKEGNIVEGVYKIENMSPESLYAITAGSLNYYEDQGNGTAYLTEIKNIVDACFKIEEINGLYTIQFWIEFQNGERHYILYKDCSTRGNISIDKVGNNW